MSIDAEQIKRNNDIATVIGRYVDLKKQGSDYKGCCPFHNENTPSFNVNVRTQTYKCFGCGEGGDVIEFIMKHNSVDFKQACEILGGDMTDTGTHTPPKKPARKKAKQEKAKLEPLSYEDAKNHYTIDALTATSQFLTEGKTFKKAWKYLNENSEVELVVARWEDEAGKKTVLTYYWDGTGLKMKNYPVLLYNRDRIKNEPEKDILIVFGEKCAQIVDEHLSDYFIPVTWNGGEKKVNEVDFTPIKNRTVFCWPDDDQPGKETAEAIKKLLPQVQTLEHGPDIIKELREIEPKGADIYEAWEYWQDPPSITDYIYTQSKRIEKPSETLPAVTEKKEKDAGETLYPFKALGVADDGKAYFIGLNDRLRIFDTTSLSKNKLMNLAPLEWWWISYGKSKDDFDRAISELIWYSTGIDFDAKRLRGRGAWSEPDGRICYHDGKVTTGEYDPDRIFLRLPKKDIGIKDEPATRDERRAIFNICNDLTFKTLADCARVLGWSALAPFAGALMWRPCLFITAGSGTGKSTILEHVINALSAAEEFTGIDTTAAGIRQNIGSDSCAITIDEAEVKDKKSHQNRSEIFGIIRQSTSNNAPKAAKGTQDGKGVNYEMKSMFCLNAINPIIDGEADEKRTSRISLVPARESRHDWLIKQKKLKEIISPKVCRAVRAYTWQNLQNIFKLTDRVSEKAQILTNIDNRTVYADSLLLAAFIVVFNDNPEPTDDYLDGIIQQIYEGHENDEKRNEPTEMVERILDEVIQIDRDKFTLRDVLTSIKENKLVTHFQGIEPTDNVAYFDPSKFRREAGNYGVGVDPDGNLAIRKNNYKIQQMLDQGRGYHMQLERHPNIISSAKNVSLGTEIKTQRCLIIEGVL